MLSFVTLVLTVMTPQTLTPSFAAQPDGPQTPLLWQMLQWVGRPLDFMDACIQRYGDIFVLKLSSLGPLVFCCHPEAIQTIFTAPSDAFDAGSGNRVVQPLMGDRSLILLAGEPHRRQRQLLMPQFHGERLRAYGDLMREVTQTATQPLQVGQSFRVRPILQAISLRVILKAVFGVNDPEHYQELLQVLPAVLDLVDSPLNASLLFFPILQQDLGAWSPWGRFLRQKAELDRLIYREIEQRRREANPERADILSLLLSARGRYGGGHDRSRTARSTGDDVGGWP